MLKIKDTVVQQPGELVQISVVFEFDTRMDSDAARFERIFFELPASIYHFFQKKNVSLRMAYNVRYNSRLHLKANIF